MSYVLAAQLAPMALLGIPSGTLVERLGARRTMLVCDAGASRSLPRCRSCTAPASSTSRFCSPSSSCSAASRRRTSRRSGDPARTGRGGRDDRAGEQPDRGRHGRCGAGRAGARGRVDSGHRRAERPLRRRRDVRGLVPAPRRLRAEDEARGERAAAASLAGSASSSVPPAGAAGLDAGRAQLRRLGRLGDDPLLRLRILRRKLGDRGLFYAAGGAGASRAASRGRRAAPLRAASAGGSVDRRDDAAALGAPARPAVLGRGRGALHDDVLRPACERADDRTDHGADTSRAPRQGDDGARSCEHARDAARVPRRRPAARHVAAGGGLRGRGGRDDGAGARLRRSRLPRRAGAGDARRATP